MFTGKKILLAVTGSIAAYKSVILLRLLTKAGANVKVIMTPSAKDFVAPLTFSTLSGHKVMDELFDEGQWNNHVMLGRWADVMIIAPLSCNTLAKMANGICDNLLLATYLSATCPVWVAPAMDDDMWKHPTTDININKLRTFGNTIIPVGMGALASGLYGAGRMAEPEDIVKELENFFFDKSLKGKKALVTAGPTFEAIDPVRFIGNHSSGKMGIALAEQLKRNGADVTLVLGPSSILVPSGINVKRVVSSSQMYDESKALFNQMDIMIMAAAVADYKPEKQEVKKIKKTEASMEIRLTKTIDILKSAGSNKRKDQILVGFALETDNEEENAIKKLKDKNADLIVLNKLNDQGAGFATDTNKIIIFAKDGQRHEFPLKDKSEVAADIIATIIKLLNA